MYNCTYFQERSGCRSQLTGLTSAMLLLGVLLLLGPLFQVLPSVPTFFLIHLLFYPIHCDSYFQPLPICVLAAIIVSSLIGMFKKLSDLTTYWERGTGDGMLWVITFLTTVFGDVDLGLVVGIAASLVLTLARGSTPTVIFHRPGKTLHLRGPLNYLTLGLAKLLVEAKIRHICKGFVGQRNTSVKLEEGEGEMPRSEDELLEGEEEGGRETLLLDLTGLTHLDQEGAGLIPWLETYLKENCGPPLGAVVAPSAMQSLIPSSSSTLMYTTLERARVAMKQRKAEMQQVL